MHGLAPGRTVEEYRERLAFELDVIEAHEISRLLPDRRRLHPVGEGAGHSGRAGPRLGRRLARRLCAHHHRSRSDPLRPPVRALPQSRARVDAGLRHRLLPGPARRGDPLRAGALRPRPGGADHHLRHAAGARRAARRRPRAGDALRPGRQALQARAAEPGQPGHAQRRRSRTSRGCRRRATAIRWSQRAFDIAQKLEGLHRHASTHAAGIVIGDRPLDRAGAALSRSEVRHAGDPVQHEMGRAGGPGEVRLPRPQDADRAAKRRSTLLRKRGVEIDLAAIPLDDEKTYEMLARGETVGIFQVESQGMRRALLDMRPDRFEDIIALVALYRPGPMANIPTYCARKHRHGGARLHPSQARADPARDLRRHRLPGTGDADRRRSSPATRSARPTCCAAPWARRSRSEMDAQRDRFVAGASSAASTQAQARSDLRLARAFRRLRLQQEPRRRLCAGRLPDRLS